tara:strand:+ start:190 stop:441 length:252 start_codon:yes stop_codon:yes gene_type:complete
MIKKIKDFRRSASMIQKLILLLVIGLLNYFLYLVTQLFSLYNIDWLIQWIELFWWLVEIIFIEVYVIIPVSIFLVYKLLPKKD